MTTTSHVDAQDLERRVKEVYRHVALQSEETCHFEMGRSLAERLGHPSSLLDRIPAAAIDSFAGVGYYLDRAEPAPGERALDLGSGSGTDSFAVGVLVGAQGLVTGVDMTDEQLAKANRRQLSEAITCNAELWASCIGGATQVDNYIAGIEAAGLQVTHVRDNEQYRFLSESAQGATTTYGIKSISLLAVKPALAP